MSQRPAAAQRTANTDDRGLLAEDVTCRSCGYNLRGLSLEGACPECRVSVAQSVRGDFLQFSDPVWVGRLARGVKWMIIGVFATIIGTVAIVFIGVLGATFAASGTVAMSTAAQAATMAVAVVEAAILVIGYWLVTSPDPGAADREKVMNVRNIARYGMIIASLQAILQAVQQSNMRGMTLPGASSSFSMAMTIGAAMLVVFMVIGLIAAGAMFIWFRTLALRIPRVGLARQTRIVMYGYMVALMVTIAMQMTIVIGGPGVLIAAGAAGPSPWFFAYLAMSCGGSLVLLTFSIWGLVLLFIYLAAFKQAEGLARAGWLSAPIHDQQGASIQPADA